MVNSRQKGKRGERMLAKILNTMFDVNCRRSQQYCGATDDSMDLVGFPGLSIECKFTEKLNLRSAMEQAAEGDGVPTVFHKKKQQDWLVTVRLEDLVQFIEATHAQVRQQRDSLPE